MTEEELRRLDGNLGAQAKSLDEQIQKLSEQIDEIGFFKNIINRTVTARSKEKLKAQREKLEEMRNAIVALQTAISVADPSNRASVGEQERAYNSLVKLEDEFNYEQAQSPIKISTEKVRSSLRNTLQVIHNRRVGASYGKIIRNGLYVTLGIFAVPIALSVLGMPALLTALTPTIWGAIALSSVRSISHLVTKFVRNRKIKNHEPKTNYEEMYPTLSNVKGFANTLSYFRGLRRHVGKRFDAITDSKLFEKYKTSGFAPIDSPVEDEEKGKDKEKDKEKGKSKEEQLEADITSIATLVVTLDVTNKDEVNKFINDKFSIIYASATTSKDVEIKNRDLLDLCNLYLKVVKAAHEGTINETAIESFLNMEGTSENFKDIKDQLVMRLKDLLEGIFKDTLSDSVREMFDKYKDKEKGKEEGGEGDKVDPDDLDEDEKKKKKGTEGEPVPIPEPKKDDLTPEIVKEEINKIIDKMSRSTSSVDFTESLKELNELIKNAREKGVAVTYDEETKMMLTMLRSYTNFSETIRSGIYDNAEFYTNLRNFLNPENEVGSDRVKSFRAILIRQLNSLVRDELKLNDSRLTGLIDYGFSKRSRGSFGTTASQVALIQNLERFDFRDFSPENISLARDMLDEMREIARMKTPENEFHLDYSMEDTLTNLEMFSSVARDRDRLSSQIKACESVISNPSGYATGDARATVENCVKTYYHIVGFVNHVLSTEYSSYKYLDRNNNTKTGTFDENGISAAVNLKLLSTSQITSLKKIMEFYKNSELRADTEISRQGQYMDEQLTGYKARR